jgi:imidazolonepropionase-like amidohydrolase
MKKQQRYGLLALLLSAVLGGCSGENTPGTAMQSPASQAPVFAVENVTVLPMEGPERLEAQTVLISEGRILRVAPRDEVIVPDGATRIDGSGRYLMPGLADMHAHPMRERDLALYLANGVTLIRSMWGEPSLLDLREQVRAGDVPGPRIYTSGRIVGGAEPHHFGTVPLGDPADARGVIEDQLDAGFDFIKIYSKMSLEVFDAVDAAAKDLSAEYSGHVPMAVSLAHAVAADMRTMEHLYGFLKTAQRAEVPGDLEWRFFDQEAQAVVEELGAGTRTIEDLLDSEAQAAIVAQIAEDGVWIVPTFSVLRMHEFRAMPENARYLHPLVSGPWTDMLSMLKSTEDGRRGEQILFDAQLALVGELYRAGANLLVGTDAPNPGVVTGFAVAEEIALMEQAGLSRLDALRAATLWPARYLGEAGKDLGRISEGAAADLLLLDEDPLADLDALRAIAGVFRAVGKTGSVTRWYPREALAGLLDAMLEENAAITARFEAEPKPLGDTLPVFSFDGSRGERLVLQHAVEDDTLRVGAAFASERDRAAWEGLETVHDESGASLRTDDGRTFRTADDGRSLLRDGETVVGAGEAPGARVILTGSPADLPVIDRAVTSLAVGDSTTFSAWLCPAITRCEDAAVKQWQLERLDDDVVDGVFYYTGVRQYRVSSDGQRLGTVKIGGGPFYGGQPMVFSIEGSALSGMERVR